MFNKVVNALQSKEAKENRDHLQKIEERSKELMDAVNEVFKDKLVNPYEALDLAMNLLHSAHRQIIVANNDNAKKAAAYDQQQFAQKNLDYNEVEPEEKI